MRAKIQGDWITYLRHLLKQNQPDDEIGFKSKNRKIWRRIGKKHYCRCKMNWKHFRHLSWIDTCARFVDNTPHGGSLLDIGSSDGETLGHFAELRPDLKLFSTDLAGSPEKYPAGCQFHRGDIQKDKLPWQSGSMNSIICLHVVEHLTS